MTEDALVEITPACRHDFADIAALARDQLPDMTYLHDADSWHERARLGFGRHPRETFTMVARQAQSLLGFFWVDAAPFADNGIAEPWWCINAVAVRGDLQGKGIGKYLAGMIKARAQEIGVTTLYGTCYPSSAAFWRSVGFKVGEIDQNARSDEPAKFLSGREQILDWQCEPGNHLFLLDVGDDLTATRLTFPHSQSA